MQLTELTRFVEDVDVAIDFYRTFLGADPVSRWPRGAVFEVDGTTLLIHEAVEHDEAPSEDHPAFSVEDVDAACDALSDRGLEVAWPPADYDWGRSAYLRDPAGNVVELIEG